MLENLMIVMFYASGIALLLLVCCTIEWLIFRHQDKRSHHPHSMRDWK